MFYEWYLYCELHDFFLFQLAYPSRLCLFSLCVLLAMITYGWCEQSRIQIKTPLSWTGVDLLLGYSVVVFWLDAMEF